MNSEKAVSNAGITFKRQRGCFCSVTAILCFAFLIIIALVAVGLIVGFTVRHYHKQLGQSAALDEKERQNGVNEKQSEERVEPVDVRLPKTFVPLHYDLEIQPFIDDATFTGNVTIHFRCEQVHYKIVLHSRALKINKSAAWIKPSNGSVVQNYTNFEGNVPTIKSFEYRNDKEFLIIKLSRRLKKGDVYAIWLQFNGTMGDAPAGFYRTSYTAPSGEVRWIGTTQMEAVDARQAFPCFDEPALKATFRITITRPDTLTSVANMPLQMSENLGNGWTKDFYYTSVTMPTYLVAFVVADNLYKGIADEDSKIQFGAWAPPEEIDKTDFALELSRDTVQFYSSYFKIPYPLQKLDAIYTPNFPSFAMENWGAIVYRPQVMTISKEMSPVKELLYGAVAIAHEVSHQWFGNIVSMAWWGDLWLNEGFATFASYLCLEELKPTWKMADIFLSREMLPVMEKDALGTSHPVMVPVSTPNEILGFFDDITYKKGASIIQMLRHVLGAETFRKALQNYLQRYSYSNARTEDLWEAFTEQTAIDGNQVNVSAMMDTWTLQMGYPLVTVNRTYGSRTRVHLSQQHFLIDPNSPVVEPFPVPLEHKYVWMIPFTYTITKAPSEPQLKWLTSKTDTLSNAPNNNDWLIANYGSYGYYRVNYDDRNWELLMQQLKVNHKVFEIRTRAKLLSDVFNIAKAGYVDQVTALKATEYLSREEDYLPLKTALDSLSYIKDMLSKTSAYPLIQAYVVQLVHTEYEKVDWKLDSERDFISELKSQMLVEVACEYEIEHCITRSLELFTDWMNSMNDMTLPSAHKKTIFCAAAKHGTNEMVDYLWQHLQNTSVSQLEKVKILVGLSCSKHPWVLRRVLETAVDSKILESTHFVNVFAGVNENPLGRRIAWEFFTRERWDWFWKTFGTGYQNLGIMVSDVTGTFNTDSEAYELNSLLEMITEADELGTAAAAWNDAVSKTRANVEWMKSNSENVITWLKQRES